MSKAKTTDEKNQAEGTQQNEEYEIQNVHVLPAGKYCVLRYYTSKKKHTSVVEKKEEKDKTKTTIAEKEENIYVNILKVNEIFLKKIRPFRYFSCLFDPIRANDPFCSRGYGRIEMVVIGMQQNMKNVMKNEDEEDEEEDEEEEDEEDEEDDDEDEDDENIIVPHAPYVRMLLNGECICQTSPLAEEHFTYINKNVKQATWDERVDFQVHNPYSKLTIELADRDTTKGVMNAYDDLFGCVALKTDMLIPNVVYDLTLEFPYMSMEDYPPQDDVESRIYGTIRQTSSSPFYIQNESNIYDNKSRTSNLRGTKNKYDIYNKNFSSKIKDLATAPPSSMHLSSHLPPSHYQYIHMKGKISKKGADDSSKSPQASLPPPPPLLPHDAFSGQNSVLYIPGVDGVSTSPPEADNTSYVINNENLKTNYNEDEEITRRKKGSIVRVLLQLKTYSCLSEMFACTLPPPKEECTFTRINFLQLWSDALAFKRLVWDMYIMRFIGVLVSIHSWENILLSFSVLSLWVLGCLYNQLILPIFFLILSISVYFMASIEERKGRNLAWESAEEEIELKTKKK